MTTPRMCPPISLTSPPERCSITPSPNQPGSNLVSVRCSQTRSIGPGSRRSNRTHLAVVICPLLFIGFSLVTAPLFIPGSSGLLAKTPLQCVQPNAPELPDVPQPVVEF